MQKRGGEALGMIETLGMVPAIYGADFMLKAANVELVSYENVGSTLVTVIVQGDMAACKSAMEAGAEAAASIGKLTASNVIPRPIRAVNEIAAVHKIEEVESHPAAKRGNAIGMIEIFGLAYILQAADAMGKAADVEIVGYENVASGYISVLAEGDVAACNSAVEAGVKAVEAMGGQVYSSAVIANPHPMLKNITARYSFEQLL